ncbi:MAG: hypothetical protein AAF363_11120 [Bacteroidota bacterium]
MFFSRLRKDNRLISHLIDLVIVFIGVYSAAMLNNYREDRYVKEERTKVLSAIKIELEGFRLFNGQWADYMEIKIQEMDSLRKEEIYTDYYTWRYLEPQYNYRIIEYATNIEGTSIIDFELFYELQLLYNDIRRLEHAEHLMTEFSNKRDMSGDPDSNPQNRFYLYKFLFFSRDRVQILRRLQGKSEEVLLMVNKRLGEEKAKEVSKNFCCKAFEYGQEELTKTLKNGFPEITESEWKELIKECDN